MVQDRADRENIFDKMVIKICEEVGVKGSGLQDHMTNHGLRASMISALIDSGHYDASIFLRTGNTRLDDLERYHNIQSVEGSLQQFGVLIQKLQLFHSPRWSLTLFQNQNWNVVNIQKFVHVTATSI